MEQRTDLIGEVALTETSCRPQLMANRVLAAELLVAPVGVGQPFAVQFHRLAEALLFCRYVSECVVPPQGS